MKERIDKVSTHQLSTILLIASISLKVLLLPSLLSTEAGTGLWLSVLIGYAFEFITLIFILKIIHTCPNQTFFEVLKNCFSKAGAIIICVFYALYFGIKCVFILCETRLFFIETLYEEFSWVLFTVPLFALICFIISKKTHVLGRLYESFSMIIIGGFIFLILAGLQDFNPDGLLPFMNKGFGGAFNGIYSHIFLFGDTAMLLGFCGRIKIEKNTNFQLKKSLIISFILVLVFMCIYYGIYENIASMLRFAISSVVQFSPRVSNMGRIDWIAICVWCVTLFLHFILITYVQKLLINDTFNVKKHKHLTGILIVIAIFAVALFIYYNIELVFNLVRQNWAIWMFVFLQYLVPIITFVILKIKGKKELKYGQLPKEVTNQ